MQQTGPGLLSLITFLPLIGALLMMLLPKDQSKLLRYVALGVSIVTFVVSLTLLTHFKGGTYHFQMQENASWIPSLGINYRLGVDGISLWLILLTTLLSIVATWFSFYVDKRIKPYFIFLLILETAMLGVFTSLDMILFYSFFEASLIPMYFLISIWGGERRGYASLKFFIYTFAGSIFMLVGMIVLAKQYAGLHHGQLSFSIVDIQREVASGKFWAGALQLQTLIFWSFSIAFLVKCPAFPFHTWLPDAHVEAPTAGSIILAGVLLKMGTYGFLRFVLPLFPDAVQTQAVWLMGLAVIGIIYGAIVAAIQPDLKKLIAYSSVAHMGFVLLGLFSLTHSGILGGTYQQLNHGIATGALFLLVGLIYERRHTRLFRDFGGLKAQMPIYATLFLIVMLASVGLPPLNGFIGEFLAMMGAFESSYAHAFGLNLIFPILAGAGTILAAVYLLYMFQQVFYGPNTNPENMKLKDIKPWEIACVGLLVVFVFWGGLYPSTFLKPMESSIGAVRLMAIAPEGNRPVWDEPEQEIDGKMNLVYAKGRTADQVGEPLSGNETVLTKANLHFPLATPQVAQSTTVKASPNHPVDAADLGVLEVGISRNLLTEPSLSEPLQASQAAHWAAPLQTPRRGGR